MSNATEVTHISIATADYDLFHVLRMKIHSLLKIPTIIYVRSEQYCLDKLDMNISPVVFFN